MPVPQCGIVHYKLIPQKLWLSKVLLEEYEKLYEKLCARNEKFELTNRITVARKIRDTTETSVRRKKETSVVRAQRRKW